jgi:hypothetical protein
MANKTTQDMTASVSAFVAGKTDAARHAECTALIDLMRDVTGCEPHMWGTMIGFGSLHYRYASGREGDTFLLGFAPRKSALTLYLSCDLEDFRPTLDRLGKHKTGKGCLYLTRLTDADPVVLRDLLEAVIADTRSRHA